MNGRKVRRHPKDGTRVRDNHFRSKLVTYATTNPRAAELLESVSTGELSAKAAWQTFGRETGLELEGDR